MATITFDDVTRLFSSSSRPAVDALNLHIEDGEFLVLVGPSGCGKSTSLRMLAGLEPVDSGRILIDDQDVTGVDPKDRDIAMVFQNYALYPHMTVAENMGFALRLAGTDKAQIAERVAKAAEILDLSPYLDRKPKALSGGQRQRVAMGRAIVRQPRVFLMDEPLSNLDAKLRVQTRTQIAQLQRRLGTTTVYVTHDQVEAMTMGDRVAVLSDGVLQQCASPRELYRSPANAFVAGFIGSPSMNLLTLPIEPENVIAVGPQWLRVPVDRLADPPHGDSRRREVQLGIRPEHIEVGVADGVPVDVDVVEELGAEAFVYGRAHLANGAHPIVARVDWRHPPEKGARVHIAVDMEHAFLFDPTDGTRLR
ncbi:ABC transporter ATP-binding protein [Millisia brevis]|uniref:ABC transporter ATP-binding protein n=1 Tax=Millisia brevis TaxID=264148 RepID=UPI00082CCBA8|nr:sn-glycerol-3-phosphate ABC transporter ATP-binding protein UgpC [Millisia brevis]